MCNILLAENPDTATGSNIFENRILLIMDPQGTSVTGNGTSVTGNGTSVTQDEPLPTEEWLMLPNVRWTPEQVPDTQADSWTPSSHARFRSYLEHPFFPN